jgi:DDE superfamily endonuclease
LRECFVPAMKENANRRKWLLICDGHDSHISAQFVGYCLEHNIVLFLLPPHSSHLLQPLDISVFGPLKQAMFSLLSRFYATEISRMQKAEWLEQYMKGCSIAITSNNINGGWRGAGLFPTNVNQILCLLCDATTSSSTLPPQNANSTSQLLVTSSPPDGTLLCTTNIVFNEALSNAALASPIQKHGQQLSSVAEHLHAENSIL